MSKTNARYAGRMRRKFRIRKKISGTAERPRLTVFRSARHMYAQIIDDVSGNTLASASSLCEGVTGGGNREGAAAVGRLLAERAKAASITAVVFDRNGFQYHGRIAALADALRESGIQL